MKKLFVLLMLTCCFTGLEAGRGCGNCCCRGGGVVVVERYGYGAPYQAFQPNPYGPPPYWGAPPPYWGNPYWGNPYWGDPYYRGGGFYFQMNFR